MNSLKSIIPLIVDAIAHDEISEHSLYERQRSLVRAGLLIPTEGRGPGSGVHLSSATVSLLLMSLLATDSLKEVGVATRKMMSLRRIQTENSDHSMPDIKTFGQALHHAIAPNTDDNVIALTAMRAGGGLVYVNDSLRVPIRFGKQESIGLQVSATLGNNVISEVKRLLLKIQPVSNERRRVLQSQFELRRKGSRQ